MDRNEIINKKFSHSFTGYDISEVDLFLDEVIREFDKKNNELNLLEFRIEHELVIAFKYIWLLRKQLEKAGIQAADVPVSILDDLRMFAQKADAEDEAEKAEDEARLDAVYKAIADSAEPEKSK